jgi:hypothetical protein
VVLERDHDIKLVRSFCVLREEIEDSERKVWITRPDFLIFALHRHLLHL